MQLENRFAIRTDHVNVLWGMVVDLKPKRLGMGVGEDLLRWLASVGFCRLCCQSIHGHTSEKRTHFQGAPPKSRPVK